MKKEPEDLTGKETRLSTAQVKKLKARIDIAKRMQKPHLETWKRMVKYLKGQMFSFPDDHERVSVNLAYSLINVIIPNLYYKNPKVLVSSNRRSMVNKVIEEYAAMTPEKDPPYSPQVTAQILEQNLEYWFKKTKAKRTIRKNIADALLQSYGVAKVGYKIDDQGFHISLKRVSPRDIFFPIGATDFDTLKMVIHQYPITLDELKKDPRYKNTKEIQGKHVMEFPDSKDSLSNSEYSDEAKRALMYELWDLEKQKVYILCDETTQDHGVENFVMDEFPFAFLAFNDVPEEIIPSADIALVESQIKEINEYRTRMIRHNKRFNRKYYLNADAFDDPEKAQEELENGEDGTVVVGSKQPSDAIAAIQDAALSQDNYMGERASKSDLRDIMQVSEMQMGGGRNSPRQTATEAKITDTSLGSKNFFRLDLVDDFIEDIARKMIKYIQKKAKKQDVAWIMGDDDVEWPIEWSEKDVQGEYDACVEAGSSTQTDERTRTSELMQALNLVLPAMKFYKLDALPLIKKILRQVRALSQKEIEAVLLGQGEDSDKQVRLAEQENEYLRTAVPQRVNAEDDDKIHLRIHIIAMKSEDFGNMGEEVVKVFRDHVTQHLQQVQQQQAQQPQMPTQPLNPQMQQNDPNAQMAGNMAGGFNSEGGGQGAVL